MRGTAVLKNDGQNTRRIRGRRVQILLEASLEFCAKERPTAEEISTYKELFFSLAANATNSDKREISIALSSFAFTPRTVAIYLALEEHFIAAPMLLYGIALTDFDLVSVCAKCPMQSVRILARRSPMSPSVVKAIRTRNDPLSNRILALNRSVKPSSAEEKAAQTAGSDLSESSKQKLARKREEILDLASTGGKLNKRKPANFGIFTGQPQADVAQLAENAKSGLTDEFFTKLGTLMGLPADQLKAILSANQEHGLPMALRSLDIARGPAAQIMLFANSEIGQSVEKLREFTSGYDRLNVETCRSQFRRFGASFHSVRPEADSARKRRKLETTTTGVTEFEQSLHSRQTELRLKNPGKQFGRKLA